MQRYTIPQRAQILYNHIYFSDLPKAHVDALLEGEFYRKIIRHERYNPRVIEWMASHQRIRSIPAAQYQTFISQLLKNPLEIWRHAYEEELSHTARSLLLVLWSFEGRIGLSILNGAFSSLHAYHASKYRFERSPQDFNRALKELNGSFTKPWGRNSFEVADPSVLDLISAILREAPDNFADILVGATLFTQIERLWMFARQKNGGILRKTWQESAREAAPIIKSLMLANRRVVHPGVGTSWSGPSYERRLAVVIEVATRIGTDEYKNLLSPIATRLMEEPVEEGVDISALVDLVILLENNSLSEFSFLIQPLRKRVFDAARLGCASDELREATRLLDNPSSGSELESLRMGFSQYLSHHYSSERWEARSGEEFERLIGDLSVFKEVLGVETAVFVQEVEEARKEFEEEEERYAEAHEDEYKERWREERYENANIADMFAGLRSDRSG